MTGSPVDLKTILVLDDDPQFHKLVVPVLTLRGHCVLSAHTGAEAKSLLQAHSVDLAIVDGQLPHTTGLQWIEDVRAAGYRMLIMFVSAYWRDAQSYHRLTKELDVALVLHKPVLAPVFAAEVDILLGKGALPAADADLEDTLLALRAEYGRQLPASLCEIDSLIKQLKAQPQNHFLAAEIRAHAHKLRGTAASYGFNEVGDAAAQLEDAILERQSAPPDGDAIAHLVRIESALILAVEKAATVAHEVESKLQRHLPAPLSDPETAAIASILVVDDDAAFLALVDELARCHELQVVRAGNAREALDMACRNEIGAALIDVDLGAQEAAFKLALDLRALPGYEDLPLGFLTGVGHIERSADVVNVGGCLLLARPTQADALSAAVRQLSAIRQASRPTVLVIDDDSDFLKRMEFILRHEGMEVRTLASTADILDEMQALAPDAVLLDVMMPGVSGFDICRMLRTMPRWRDLPIVFLTGYADIDTRVACLKCGGDDYLAKPVVNEELLVRLRMLLERSRQLKERLERDNVTGLLNRRPFMEQLAGMLSEAQRHCWTATLCLMELVGLDDCRRSSVSDSVLGVAGNLLSKRVRIEHPKGRWCKERLMVAFRNEPQTAIETQMQAIAQEFGATQILQHDGCCERPVVRFGLACYPDDGDSVHELVRVADMRLKQGQETPARAR